MNVKKIFMTLIIIVVCVILGAFIINTLLPNVATTLVNATEDQIFKATGLSFDFNNDSHGGQNGNAYTGEQAENEQIANGGTVDGWGN